MNNFKKIDYELRHMLICTFGYSEVEDEIKERCLEAIRKKDMSCLKKDLVVYCSGEGIVYEMKAMNVCLILYRYGIWQYVKNKILYG